MRSPFLDRLRWGTVLLVLGYRVLYLFNDVGVFGAIAPPGPPDFGDLFLTVVYPWFMFLLFVVAGIAAERSLRRRAPRQFLSERTTKLLVPSTLGLFVYHWVAGAIYVKLGGQLDKIPFAIRYPIFAVSGTGPMWFAQLLYLYSLATLVVLPFAPRAVRLLPAKSAKTLVDRAPIAFFALLFAPVWASAQVLNAPVITTYRFGVYGAAYWLGFVVFSRERVLASLERTRLVWALLAVGFGVWHTTRFFGSNYVDDACLRSVPTNAYLWATTLAALGWARKYGNRETRFSAFATRASFGWYVVHFPATLAICVAFDRLLVAPKPVVVGAALVASFAATFVLAEIIRRIPVVRFAVLGIVEPKRASVAQIEREPTDVAAK